MDIFKAILPSILQTNKYCFDEAGYNQYIINKSLSGYIDCLLYVNEINQYKNIDNKLHYDYLFYSIRKYKRPYCKWIKKDVDKDIELIREYYGYNKTKSKDILNILMEEQKNYIKQYLDKGGK